MSSSSHANPPGPVAHNDQMASLYRDHVNALVGLIVDHRRGGCDQPLCVGREVMQRLTSAKQFAPWLLYLALLTLADGQHPVTVLPPDPFFTTPGGCDG